MFREKTFCILVRDRFFIGIINSRVRTAWCLAGGSLFTSHTLVSACSKLEKRGVKFAISEVVLV